jgi:hypothetical protein
MLFPMLLISGHNAAMFLVTILMISEHLEHPQVPHWRINFSFKVLKIFYAQTYMSFQRVSYWG